MEERERLREGLFMFIFVYLLIFGGGGWGRVEGFNTSYFLFHFFSLFSFFIFSCSFHNSGLCQFCIDNIF